MKQISIFEELYETYKIDCSKTIRTIEMFAGYGSQLLGLKRLQEEYPDLKVEQWRICEWAIKSIQAYKDLHFPNSSKNYSLKLDSDTIKSILDKVGISADYNNPMSKEQINKLSEHQVRTIYNNIVCTHNLVNICNVKGRDLQIIDKDNNTYLFTYSFPCQDLSLAGLKKGMSDTSTRSGLLWEVERILNECKDCNEGLPDILLMENVPQVHSAGDNSKDFCRWQLALEKLGYSNYWEDCNSKEIGYPDPIPQNRERTFMVSILNSKDGDAYNYSFPQKKKLKTYLRDLLETNVPKSYYLDAEKLKKISEWKAQQDPLKDIDREKLVSPTLTARGAGEDHSGMILINEDVMVVGNYSPSGHNATRIVSPNGVAPTVMENHGSVTAIEEPIVSRIRKLTPKECFRLMGLRDEEYERIAKHQSQSSLYHLAGDSIVVNVICAIIKEML